MNKTLLAIGLILVTPSFATTSFIPQSILKKYHHQPLIKKTAPLNDEYVNFSGHWLGSCDPDPDEETKLTIKLAPDFSSIELDHVVYPIDAIVTQGL